MKAIWVSLTRTERVIAVCLLVYYVAMIGVTIATLPFNAKGPNDRISVPLNLN